MRGWVGALHRGLLALWLLPALSGLASLRAEPLRVEVDDKAAQVLLEQHLDLARALARATTGEPLDAQERERLCRLTASQAAELLQTLGRFAPGEPELDCAAGRLRLSVGPQARWRGIDFQLGAGAPAPQDWRSWLTLREGQPFTQTAWSEAKREVLARARAGGHVLARWAITRAEIDAEAAAVDAQLLLDAGPEIHLGPIALEGLQHHDAQRVGELLGLASGQPYREAQLLDAQERLRKSGLFDSVQVELDPGARVEDRMPVRVRLREAPLQQLGLGLGWSSEGGPRSTFEHQHRRPLGQALRSRLRMAWARDSQALDAELSTHPRADLRRLHAALRWEREQGTEAPYRQTSLRFGQTLETPAYDRSLLLEALASHAGFGASGSTADSLALHWNPTWRRLDSVLLPTDGQVVQLQLAAGRARSRQIGESAQRGAFARLQARWQIYRPIGEGRLLSARLEAAQIAAPDALELPESMRFRAGGDESVRGYTHRSLGPQSDGAEVGGRVLWTASAELAQPLPKDWVGGMQGLALAAFVDAGQAARSWSDARAAGAALGAGLGLRWRSPIGLLRADLARGQGRYGGGWRVHVSVGLAL